MLNYSHIFAANIVSYVGSRVYLFGGTKAMCVSHTVQCEKENLHVPLSACLNNHVSNAGG
jgi:hypothetical protein